MGGLKYDATSLEDMEQEETTVYDSGAKIPVTQEDIQVESTEEKVDDSKE